jgi:hypothetical protein
MAWARNGTPNTLGSAGDDLDITDLTAYKFNQFLTNSTASSGNQAQQNMTFNNNSSSVYAIRSSVNGVADVTSTSQTFIQNNIGHSAWGNQFEIIYVVSISGEEKLIIQLDMWGNTAGAGNAPERGEIVAKFVPSPDADITRIDMNNNQSGSFQIDDNISALGTN